MDNQLIEVDVELYTHDGQYYQKIVCEIESSDGVELFGKHTVIHDESLLIKKINTLLNISGLEHSFYAFKVHMYISELIKECDVLECIEINFSTPNYKIWKRNYTINNLDL